MTHNTKKVVTHLSSATEAAQNVINKQQRELEQLEEGYILYQNALVNIVATVCPDTDIRHPLAYKAAIWADAVTAKFQQETADANALIPAVESRDELAKEVYGLQQQLQKAQDENSRLTERCNMQADLLSRIKVGTDAPVETYWDSVGRFRDALKLLERGEAVRCLGAADPQLDGEVGVCLDDYDEITLCEDALLHLTWDVLRERKV